MPEFKVTRAHLKAACDQQNWDLLDKLLEIDNSQINDNSLYTDTWGDWWGMLLDTIKRDSVNGVKVLLKHGADRDLASWGDPGGTSPLEAARDKPEILTLLQSTERPDYLRQTNPPFPDEESIAESAVNRQGQIRDTSGMVFQPDGLEQGNK